MGKSLKHIPNVNDEGAFYGRSFDPIIASILDFQPFICYQKDGKQAVVSMLTNTPQLVAGVLLKRIVKDAEQTEWIFTDIFCEIVKRKF